MKEEIDIKTANKLLKISPKKILFKNPDVLDPDKEFIPDKLLFRREQALEIIQHLSKIIQGLNPGHMILRGPTGTGKTLTMKFALKPFQQYIKENNLNIGIAYASGHSMSLEFSKYKPSPRRYIAELMNSLGYKIEVPKKGGGFGTNDLLMLFREYINSMGYKHVVFILDDIHKIWDLSFIMYFARPQEVWRVKADITAFLITSDARAINRIPREAKYSFSNVNLHFPPYNATELADILKQRLEYALEDPSVIPEWVPNLIGAKVATSGGDARYALRILKLLLEEYINLSEEIKEEDIERAMLKVDYEDVSKVVDNLPLHSKILLLALLINGGVLNSKNLYNNYVNICKKINMKPLSPRRVRDNISALNEESIIFYEVKGSGRGMGKLSIVSLPHDPATIKAIIKALQTDLYFRDYNWEKIEEYWNNTLNQFNEWYF